MNTVIKLVIFDLDGTLVDAYKGVASSLNYTLGQLGRPAVDHDSIKKSVGWGDRHLVATFLDGEDVDRALSIFRQHHSRALKDGTVFLPGAKRVLAGLKKDGYLLAVATNRPTRFTHIILKFLGIQQTFDCVLCGDKVERPKPAPDILNRILAKFDLRPEHSIYVGDMTVDVETGYKAGVTTVAVATGSSTKEELAALHPYKVVDSVTEVPGIINEIKVDSG